MKKNLQTLQDFIKLKAQKRIEHKLTTLMWEPTLVCNLECLHCSNACVTDVSMKKEELSTQEIKDILLEVSMKYDASQIHFVVTGGEPLMRHDLCEVGAYAYGLGFSWSITTNAMLLTQSYLDALEEAHIGQIAISLDGIEADHNKLRNHPKSYQKCIKAIKTIQERKFYKKLDILTCVSQINHQHLDAFVEKLLALKIDISLRLIPMVKQGRATEHEALALDAKALHDVLVWVKNYRVNPKQNLSIALSDDGYYGSSFECEVREHLHYCGAGIEWASIMHNGDVTGATNISSDYKVGNIRNDSFVRLWEEEFFNYRKGRKEAFSSQCQGCETWILCEGGGFHLLDEVKEGSVCRYYQLEGIIDD